VSTLSPYAEPVKRTSISSAVAEEITEFMRQTFVGTRSRFARAEGGARFAVESGETPVLAGDRIRSTLDYSQTTDPFDYLLFFVVNGGAVAMDTPAEGRTHLTRGGAALCPVGVPVGFVMQDIDLSVVRLPVRRLEQTAQEIDGVAGSQLRFDAPAPISPAMHRYWRAIVNVATGALLDRESPLAYPLVAEEMTRTIAVAALHAFPNTTMNRDYVPGPGRVAPAALRRAAAYIEANAHDPVVLSDIAAAAGLSVRALQYAFRRHFDVTPLGYLRHVRLERAHRELQAADPARGDTVAVIAARWGFAKPGHFAAAYRARFGLLPSQTLRR
jgi:AraC-like DNA-binding protein